jgi:hypothetical protein
MRRTKQEARLRQDRASLQRRGRLIGGRGLVSAALRLQVCDDPLVAKQEAPARVAQYADRGFRQSSSGRPRNARRDHWLTRLTFSQSERV